MISKAPIFLIFTYLLLLTGCATTTNTPDISMVGNQDLPSQNQEKLDHAMTY